ncbi:MAG: hypothetical protein ABIZ80_13545, partial [Bryobacteraceae bacterium]
VREYQVQDDRVRYYSVERSDWEEIPRDLVDLKRTESERAERKEKLAEESRLLAEEDKAERQRATEVAKVPQGPGVHYINGDALSPLKQADTKIHNKKGRSILKVLAPIPIVTGKSTVEIDGVRAAFKVTSDRPEFYFRLTAEQRFTIIRLRPDKNVRIVEKVTIMPVTNEMVEEPEVIEIFRQQVEEGLYKIWPTKPLEPGEYAVVEYTEGKVNMLVWDFSYMP